ncbi:MAG: SDR family oxidoreductase [Phycisphaerae bacterium]|nr:SDR family oxidoreductase [Phycisphaerae bacterium]
MELTGKIALVTGSAKRIGKAIALALAHAGADVIIHYNRSQADAKATAGCCRLGRSEAESHLCIPIQADLSKPEQIEAMFVAVGEKFGRLDVLVNNAAIFKRTPLETLSAEDWDSQMNLNARAPALCITHALPLMNDGGAIINITDIAAETSLAGYPAYCASKAALLALTKSAAKALADRGIRVNAVAPGAILWADDISEAEKQTVLDNIPLKRLGCPDDIAEAVVFLIQQDYITGQTLRIDGGWYMG